MDYIAVSDVTTGPMETSRWPLPGDGARILVPQPLVTFLQTHPLTRDCHPHGFGFYPRARGHVMARRQHRDHLLIYCVGGRGQVQAEGVQLHVQEGDLLLLRQDQVHRYAADRREPWSIYWVHLGGEQATSWLEEITSSPATVVTLGYHGRLVEHFQSLLAVADAGYQPDVLVYAASLLKGLLSYAALLARRRQRTPDTELDVERINDYLRGHLHERLTLDTLVATTSRLSRYHFIRAYKAITGQTPMQAFLHMKISQACYMLEITTLNISDIARHFGYDDPYYFSRLFKKVVGVSPSDYRRSPVASRTSTRNARASDSRS